MALLLTNSLAHLMVDAVCAAALFSCGGDLTAELLLYNTLAFTLQCPAGLLMDALPKGVKAVKLAACIFAALACMAPLPELIKAAALGLANCFFHISAGAETLNASGGRAAPLGVFVAPGAIGLALGTLYPGRRMLFAAALLMCAVLLLFARAEPVPAKSEAGPEKVSIWIPALLLLAVAARAVGGSAVAFPWRTGNGLILLTVLCVFAGKTLGGFLCDAMGASKTALFTIPLAAALTALCQGYMLPSMAGQLLLNLTMPVTLWLIWRALPGEPGFAFGLAASALWPGTLAGGLFRLAGAGARAGVAVSFVFGLVAIIISEKYLGRKKL